MTALPALVIEKDHRLQKASDDLAQLRWHWTLDETNTERVSFREYARQVGTAWNTVSYTANGYAAWLAASVHEHVHTPGEPQTVGDHIELAKMGGERQEATKAIAKATGQAITSVTSHKRQEIDNVVNIARERAVDKGTTVEHEIKRAADWHAKTRKAADVERDEKKRAHTMRFVEIEGHLGTAMQRLRKVLTAAEDVDFTTDERELITDSLAKMRALLNLVDLRITGATEIDWDAEMAKIGDLS